ncbi:MAG TPA: T9SS type A sorting domain-containing protein [Bacteroidia bacterium]|nr:T9SS type A sorting domain-containing protein [Bacteroidia bacterium]
MKNNYNLSRILKGISTLMLVSITTITYGAASMNANPIITKQPTNSTVCQGDYTYFSIVATGADAYQWQVKIDGSTTWDDAVGGDYNGGTTDTLRVSGSTTPASFRCLVTGGGVVDTSDVAILSFYILNQTVSAKTTQVCRADSTLIILGSSQVGVDYYLRAGTQTIGGPYAGTGSSLSMSTGPINATTAFNVYAQSAVGGCTKVFSQTPQISMYTVIPTITSTMPGNHCLEGYVVLSATASEGDLYWFSSPTGGTVLGTGTFFTTPLLTTTTTFYVSAFQKGCSSARKEVVARINQLPDVSVKLNGLTLKAVSQNTASYQWMSCITNKTIAGANDSIYVAPQAPGKYAVIITLNTCKDTSDCVQIFTTGVESPVATANQLMVYPNPSRDIITVQSTSAGTFNIVNELGQLVQSFQLNGSNNFSTTIENLKTGMYIIMGTGDQQAMRQKVIITRD